MSSQLLRTNWGQQTLGVGPGAEETRAARPQGRKDEIEGDELHGPELRNGPPFPSPGTLPQQALGQDLFLIKEQSGDHHGLRWGQGGTRLVLVCEVCTLTEHQRLT